MCNLAVRSHLDILMVISLHASGYKVESQHAFTVIESGKCSGIQVSPKPSSKTIKRKS